MSIEMDFIDVMHAGMQRYSRPLRHCILNPRQHFTLFQNIEKVALKKIFCFATCNLVITSHALKT